MEFVFAGLVKGLPPLRAKQEALSCSVPTPLRYRPLYQLETLWYKDDDPIERAGVRYFFNGPWNRTLSLLDVGPNHEGTYRCLVRLKSALDDPLVGTMQVAVQGTFLFFLQSSEFLVVRGLKRDHKLTQIRPRLLGKGKLSWEFNF